MTAAKVPPYAMVPLWVLAMIAEHLLPPECLAAYVAVVAHTRRGRRSAYPSQATIARETGQSERSVRRHLKALEAAGVITRTRRSNGRGGRSSDLVTLAVERPERPGPTGHGCPVVTGHGWPVTPGHGCPVNQRTTELEAYEPDASTSPNTSAADGGQFVGDVTLVYARERERESVALPPPWMEGGA